MRNKIKPFAVFIILGLLIAVIIFYGNQPDSINADEDFSSTQEILLETSTHQASQIASMEPSATLAMLTVEAPTNSILPTQTASPEPSATPKVILQREWGAILVTEVIELYGYPDQIILEAWLPIVLDQSIIYHIVYNEQGFYYTFVAHTIGDFSGVEMCPGAKHQLPDPRYSMIPQDYNTSKDIWNPEIHTVYDALVAIYPWTDVETDYVTLDIASEITNEDFVRIYEENGCFEISLDYFWNDG